MPDIFYVLLRRLRTPLIVLILMYAISVLGFTLIPGQDATGQTWHMSFFHAMYLVSYTATTIGFGEIPYAFTEAQRLWMMFVVHLTVIGWLYSIGSLLAVLQDPAFRKLRSEYTFQRSVKRLRTPFYLVCGYGDTGGILVKALADEGIKAVVIDKDESRINALELNDYIRRPLGLLGDAAKPAVLEMAGITNNYCVGVIALTDTDQTNLMVALSAYLLNPNLRVLARAESAEVEANIRSFGKNEVINPFETFAGRLALAIHSPGMYTLFTWLTGIPHEPLHEPLFPERGLWLIAGYGRFGKALYRRLQEAGIPTQVIESDPLNTEAPEHTIVGSGTDALTLQAAGLQKAVGIVAGTHDDANNLSILMTARELKRDIFIVARQNQRDNDLVFEKAAFNLLMKRGDVIAHKIFALLRTPLISDFLEAIKIHDDDWANLLVSRVLGITTDEVPYLWEIKLNKARTPALYKSCLMNDVILLDVLRDPRERTRQLPAIPLLLKRQETVFVLPAMDMRLEVSDRLLMCAAYSTSQDLQWATQNENVLHYLLTGQETSGGDLWRRL
ncbi:MAG: NAD-binding protein [Candidatus Thiothrix putei]|uniref:NAD-binding protein n=1 Tax=Candidatus Thiothrix putei TaxID=3080811 RepID=A0AA95HGU4_9GAMM|nr:NAD-binding protein [Thiothrix caldifontis]WGZ95920.1 MAG: NAD-binding protein [Candidatus Thiothrix putei]